MENEKIFKNLFVALLMMILFPVSTYANSGPNFDKYEVIITNPEGADLYEVVTEDYGQRTGEMLLYKNTQNSL